jgi:NADH-quinone oxidoreductase subunit H
MSLLSALVALLVFPGLVYAVPMAWLMLWIERKLRARLQGRIGPPFYQPFFDFVKLAAKRPVPRERLDSLVFTGLAVLAVGSALGALALLPVSAESRGFSGDLVLLVGLLELPPLCLILAGFASRSIFGEVGAIREAILSISANVPFLGALVALAASAGSLSLVDVALLPPPWVRVPALLALALCLPVKLRINPFSLANAEQEIYAGPTTELDGIRLALWELAHGLEWVVLVGLTVCLAAPVRSGSVLADALLFVVLSLALVLGLTVVAAATARLKVPQASQFYWRWGLGLAVLALVGAALPTGVLPLIGAPLFGGLVIGGLVR